MALFTAKVDTTGLETALRQARLARPPVPRRRKTTVTDRGMLRLTVYFSPNELAALDGLCTESAVNRSVMLRALIRQAKPCKVDSPDE